MDNFWVECFEGPLFVVVSVVEGLVVDVWVVWEKREEGDLLIIFNENLS